MPPSRVEGPISAWFYILRLRSGALYVGATTDIDQRYADHGSGRACRSTRLDPPVALIYAEELPWGSRQLVVTNPVDLFDDLHQAAHLGYSLRPI
jgi:hypothetical protein